MPTFYTEDMDISPEEFLEDCDSEEIKEAIDYLKNMGYLNQGINSINTTFGQNPLDEEWEKLTTHLLNIRLSMSNEDEQIIRSIAKKYGHY
jgi:hypothetical protein